MEQLPIELITVVMEISDPANQTRFAMCCKIFYKEFNKESSEMLGKEIREVLKTEAPFCAVMEKSVSLQIALRANCSPRLFKWVLTNDLGKGLNVVDFLNKYDDCCFIIERIFQNNKPELIPVYGSLKKKGLTRRGIGDCFSYDFVDARRRKGNNETSNLECWKNAIQCAYEQGDFRSIIFLHSRVKREDLKAYLAEFIQNAKDNQKDIPPNIYCKDHKTKEAYYLSPITAMYYEIYANCDASDQEYPNPIAGICPRCQSNCLNKSCLNCGYKKCSYLDCQVWISSFKHICNNHYKKRQES